MKLLLIGCLLGTAFYANALGQGRVAVPDRASVTNTSAAAQTMGTGDPTIYSRSVNGQILSLDTADNSVVVNVQGKRVQFLMQKDTRMRADKSTELAGKTDISLADYKPGQTVKIIYRVSDNKTLEVRLRRPKS
jgi:hypothetical protein